VNVETWVQEVREITRSSIAMEIAGNKSDLIESRQVSEEEGKRLGTKLSLEVLETSAMSGENVNGLFTALVRRILEQIKKGEIPLSEVKNKLTGDFNKSVPPSQRIVNNEGCSC
jgi:GTPase SAR1 family protein